MDQKKRFRGKIISFNFGSIIHKHFFSFDIQGVHFTINSAPTKPWMKEMKKIPDSKDEYEFSGPMPDVWFALQVNYRISSNNVRPFLIVSLK